MEHESHLKCLVFCFFSEGRSGSSDSDKDDDMVECSLFVFFLVLTARVIMALTGCTGEQPGGAFGLCCTRCVALEALTSVHVQSHWHDVRSR